jgi:hypothetical protein
MEEQKVTPQLNNPQIPEVKATVQDAVKGPSFTKRVHHFLQQVRKQGVRLTVIEGIDQITRVLTGAPTHHFTRIAPGLHVGGQFQSKGWHRLEKRGITAVVSMRAEFDDRLAGIAPPRYLYLPTVDNTAPSLDHLCIGAKFIGDEIARGGKVYIHCWEGVGRAPTMAAAYLVSQGMTPEDAWCRISEKRPFIRPSEVQIERLKAFELLCKSQQLNCEVPVEAAPAMPINAETSTPAK